MREAPAITDHREAARGRREGAGLRSGGDEGGQGHLRRARSRWPTGSYDALKGADALVIVTEWNEFREPDFARMRKLLKTPVIFDGRNIYSPAQMKEQGFTYYLDRTLMPGLRGILTDPLLSVVMPVYNERDTIEEMIGRVLAVPDPHRAHRRRRRLEGRHPRHPAGARSRSTASSLIFQERNQGKGAALRRGFQEVTGDLVVIQDADLEYSPEEYPDLIELICTGPGRRGLRLAIPRPPPGVSLHALPGQPAPDAASPTSSTTRC